MNQNKQILIIDDEPFNRKLIKLQLKNLFYDFHEADDHSLAFNILDNNNIDLVLCDIKLHGLSGIEILKKIKSKFTHIPVIMLSSYNEEEYISTAREFGCFDYLSKPIEKKKLVEIANNALKSNAQ